MPRKSLCFGFKIAFKSESNNNGYVTATNNVLLPLGVASEEAAKKKTVQFENAIFQIVTGDGDAGPDLTTRKIGEELKFGMIVRLLHVNTNQLVCENRRVRATKEKVNQKVVMAPVTSEEARSSRWRVMPRYKVRSEGEKVCDKDRIILQSIAGDSYFHVATLSDSSTDHFHEVNASHTASGFTLQAYDTEEFNPDARELRGGDCLQLYHKEERAFLVGNKAGECILEPAEVGKSNMMQNVMNSNSMFVLEYESVVDGGLVTFGRRRRYHLKSLSTGMYLNARMRRTDGLGSPYPGDPALQHSSPFTAVPDPDAQVDDDDVDNSLEVSLTDDPDVPETKICFHQATDDSSNVVKKNSRVFLEFPLVKEGVWFSCGGAVLQTERRKSSTVARAPQENSRPKKQVVVTRIANHKDGTELIKVNAREFQDLNAVLALIPPIQRLVSEMEAQGRLPSIQLVSQVRENIITLTRLCTKSGEENVLKREGTPLVSAQNRMIDQNVPALCLSLVEAILAKGSWITHDNISNFAVIEETHVTPPSQALGESSARESMVQTAGQIHLKYSDFLHMTRLCFRLVMLSCFQNTRNRNLLADSIDRIMPYIEYSYGALDALRQICTDNARVVDTPDDLKFADTFVNLALANCQKQSQYLDFLGLLCTCNQAGLKKAQTNIAEQLFNVDLGQQKKPGEAPVFMKLVLSGMTGEVMVQYHGAPPPASPAASRSSGMGRPVSHMRTAGAGDDVTEISFHEFCQGDQELGSNRNSSSRLSVASGSNKSGAGNNSLMGYFSTQIDLFVHLCMGRHLQNIYNCSRFIPHGAVLPLIRNESTPPALRSLFLQYWLANVLDVPPYEDRIDACRNIVYIWETDSIGIDVEQHESDPQSKTQIGDMKDFLRKFFLKNSSLDPSDMAFNKCVLSAVRVCSLLTRFGLLVGPRESYVPWVECLIPVLDGRDDKVPVVDDKYSRTFSSNTFLRYKFDEDNQIMMEVKTAVAEIIEMMMTFVRARKVRELLTVFRMNRPIPHMCCFMDLNENSEVDKLSKKLKEKRIEAKEQENANMLMASLGKVKSAAGAGLGAMKAVGGAIAGAIAGGEDKDPLKYISELLDVLLDNMRYDHEPVVALCTTLFLQVMNTQQSLLAPLASVQILSSSQGVDYYMTVKPQLAALIGYTQFAIARQDFSVVQGFIEALANSLLRSQNDVTINAERQGILKNMGAHLTVSQILCTYTDTSGIQSHTTEMLAEGYRFLSLMLSDNQEVALDLFPFADKYVRHLVLNIGAVQFLTRMFEGNFDLVSSVSDATIMEIVYALPRTDKDPSIAHLLHLFVHQTIGNMGTIVRNHQTVLKNLLECDESSPGILRCRDFWTGSQGRKNRKEKLYKQEYLDPRSEVLYHLEMMSIVTHCAHGRDQQRRMDIRHALFASQLGLDDVLDVLVHDDSPYFFRAVYMRFFREVFVNDKTLRIHLLENKYHARLLGIMQNDLMELDAQLHMLSDAQGGFESAFDGAASPEVEDLGPLAKKLHSGEAFLFYLFEGVLPLLTTMLQDVFTQEFGTDEDTCALETLEDYQDKLRDLAELVMTDLTLLTANHPQQPPEVGHMPLPGMILSPNEAGDGRDYSSPQAPEAEEEKEGGFFGFGGKKKAPPTDRQQMKEVNPEVKKVPLKFRSGVELYFREINEFIDQRAERPLAELPYVPLESLKRMKTCLEIFTEHNYRDSDPDIRELMQSVDRYVLPKGAEVNAAVGGGEDMGTWGHFQAWNAFRRRFEESCEQTSDEHRSGEAARVLLKKGHVGTQAVKSIVRIVDHHCLTEIERIGVLNLLRQVIICEAEDDTDMTLLIPPKEEDEEDIDYRQLLETLTLDKDQEKRQDIIASWQNACSLPPKIMTMLSSNSKDLLQATLQLGCDLLRDGNNKVQTAIHNFMIHITDEEFFVDSRAKLLLCREEVRDRRRAIKRECPEEEKNKRKLPDDLHQRLERRFNFGVTEQLMELTQLLCEGHYQDMQDYLRAQEDNQISINVLEPMISVLEALAKSVDRKTLGFTIQALNTITETMQGPCTGNQEFVVSQNAGEIATYILGSYYGDCSKEGNWELRMATMTLLLSVFEGHMNTQLIQVLISSVSLDALGTLMDSTYQDWADEMGIVEDQNILSHGLDAGKDFFKGLFIGLGGEDEFKDTLNLSCSIFIFLKATLDLQALTLGPDAEADAFVDKNGTTIRGAFRRSKSYRKVSEKMATIEIMRHGVVEKAYFRVPASSKQNLRETAKDDLIREVNRSGDTARLTDFFARCFNLIREIEYYEDMQKTPGLALIYKYAWYFDTGSLLIAFVMNIFLLFTVDYKNVNHPVNVNNDGEAHEAKAYMAFGIILIIGQCVIFVNFFFGPVRIRLNECWMQWQDDKNQEAIKESKKSLSIEPPKLQPDAEKKLTPPIHWAYDLFFIATWWPFYQRGMFICTAFMGYYVSPVWYCVQLLQIVEKSAQLQNVVLSVTRNGRNLALTACLLGVVLYIFSIIAYYNYSEYFIWEISGWGANCDTLARCTMVLIVYGLRAGGGAGEAMGQPIFGSNGDDTEAYLRMVYDFCFFLFLIIICLNIVFGIILDTFGELRQERDYVQDDQHNKCFICGLNRSDFDRVATSGFEQHYTFEHHMWDYLFFMHYVKLKDSDQHNGQEGFVQLCMNKMEPKFFPRGRAMVLDCFKNTAGGEDDDGDDSDNEGEGGGNKKGGGKKSDKGGKKGDGRDGGGGGDDELLVDASHGHFGAAGLDVGTMQLRQQVNRLEDIITQMAATQMQQQQAASASQAAAAAAQAQMQQQVVPVRQSNNSVASPSSARAGAPQTPTQAPQQPPAAQQSPQQRTATVTTPKSSARGPKPAEGR